MKILDLKASGYSQEYVISFLETIGKEGRDLYLTQQIPLDLIYPSLLAITGALFIALFSKKINSRLGVIMFIPIVGAIFDYLENSMVAVMLLSFPHITKPMVVSSSIFTVSKTFFDSVYLVLLVILFGIFLYKIVRGKNKREDRSTISS